MNGSGVSQQRQVEKEMKSNGKIKTVAFLDVEKFPWAPSRGQASGLQEAHLLLMTLKICLRTQMLKINLSEAQQLRQSEAVRLPQPGPSCRCHVVFSQRLGFRPSDPECVRMHPSLHPVSAVAGRRP